MIQAGERIQTLFVGNRGAHVIPTNVESLDGSATDGAAEIVDHFDVNNAVGLNRDILFARGFNPPKLSPFTDVQFEGGQVIVTYDGQTCQWLELDALKVEDIVTSSKKQFRGQWQKRIREDLVEVLWGMNHKPGNMVKLRLLHLKTKRDFVVENAPMTEANRKAIRNAPLRVSKKVMQRYVGRYQLAPKFIFTVSIKDDKLMVGITNQPTNQVFPQSETEWFYKGVKATLKFQLDKDGKCKSLQLLQNGMTQTAKRIK